jgi:undecaprenyl-phosphate galactose phosphotransferase
MLQRLSPSPPASPYPERIAFSPQGRGENNLTIQGRHQARQSECARWLFGADLAVLVLSFPVTAWLSSLVSSWILHRQFMADAWDFQRLMIFAALSGVLLLSLINQGHYRKRTDFDSEVHAVLKTIAIIALCDSFLLFALKYDFSRLWLISNWLVAAVGLCAVRALVKKHLMKTGRWALPTWVIGSAGGAVQVAEALNAQPHLGYHVTAIHAPQNGEDLLGTLNQSDAAYIVLATATLTAEGAGEIQLLLSRARVPFSFAPAVHGLALLGMEQQILFSHDVMMMTMRDNLAQPIARVSKMAFDYAVTLAALAVLWPFMLIIAAVVKLQDGGAVFYRQQRLGQGGTQFDCLKFRTMRAKADEFLEQILRNDPRAAAEWHADHKLRDDPRITRLGKFLRRTSLDELPQLLNVLLGHMSLVGPRPITADEAPKYGAEFNFYDAVRPGITGLWQVSGRNDVSYARRVELDGWYSRNWSLWLDVVILMKTIPALLERRGSY